MRVTNGGFNAISSSLFGALLEDGWARILLLLDHQNEIQIDAVLNDRIETLLKRL